MKKEFEIWTEGYAATGERGTATFHGRAIGETFEEACISLLPDRLDKDSNSPDGYRRFGGRLSIWACRCFDNEADARKSFG